MLTRLPIARPTRNELWILQSGDVRRFVKSYVGADAQARRDAESGLLHYWNHTGYAVPAIFPTDVPEISSPYLVMSWIDAPSLRDLLSGATEVTGDWKDPVQRVLAVCSSRHARAIASNDLRLVRDDANTGNFLLDESKVYHIDFERPPKGGDLLDAAAVELAKLLRWIVRDLGRERLDAVLKLAVEAYADQPALPARIISRTCDRRGQFFHRLLDRRRRAHPGAITKYDIADGLRRFS